MPITRAQKRRVDLAIEAALQDAEDQFELENCPYAITAEMATTYKEIEVLNEKLVKHRSTMTQHHKLLVELARRLDLCTDDQSIEEYCSGHQVEAVFHLLGLKQNRLNKITEKLEREVEELHERAELLVRCLDRALRKKEMHA